jgi:hypothetical protein
MNRNLTKNTKISKRHNNIEIDRDTSIENVSLSPQPQSDNTRTYKISSLVNKLIKKTKKVLLTYKNNRKMLKTKPSVNKHFGNRISRAIGDLDDVIKYMDSFLGEKKFREFSMVPNNKSKKKKK